MTFIKPQRQAAPWSQHNFWGQFSTAASLPNTPGSDIQVSSTELQEGDVAWAADFASLFVCTDPTAGAAVWAPLPQGTPSPSTATAIELWVDGDNGSDNNPGTQALPLQTVDAALNQVPTYLNRDYVVHVLEAPIQGPYQAPSLEREFFCGAFRLAIVGEDFTVIDSGTLTGFTNTSGNPWLLEDNTQAWSADEHIVRFVRLTSGAAAGALLNVIENDATTIRTAGAGVLAAIGDSYEIVRPAVRIEGFSSIGGSEYINGISFGLQAQFNADTGGLLLANLEVASSGLFAISGYFQAYGVVLTGGRIINNCNAGLPQDLSFLNSSAILIGMGAGLLAEGGNCGVQGNFAGVLNAEGVNSFVPGDSSSYVTGMEVLAGRFWAGGPLGCFNVRYSRVAVLGVASNNTDDVGRLLIRPALGETVNIGLFAELGGVLHVEDSMIIDCTDAGSVGIRARGVNSAAMLRGGTVDAVTRGILAQGGGQAQITGNGALITTGGSNIAAVEANGTTADTGGGGAFTTDLNFVTSAVGDFSTIRRVDT